MRRVRVVAVVALTVAASAVAPAAAAAPAAPAPPAVWTNVPSPPMSGDTSQKVYEQVDVVPGGAVFATGYTRHDLPGTSEVRSLVERWDGSSWQTMTTPDVETAPAADYLRSISGTSATDVWAVGSSATAPGRPVAVPFAIHWDGTSWTKVPVPDPSGGAGAHMNAVVALAPDDVWAVGTAYPLEAMGAAYHWDGRAWSSYRLPLLPGCKRTNYTQLTAITATPNGDVYAGGDCPTRTGYAGFVVEKVSLDRWTVVARMAGTSAIADMTAAADGTVWATGTSSANGLSRPFLLSGRDTTWTKRFRPAPTDRTTEQVHGVAVTARGITMVGERNANGQRAPWGATLLPDGHWQQLAFTAPQSVTWMAAVDGSATGPTWAMGQYLGNRADIVGFAAYPR